MYRTTRMWVGSLCPGFPVLLASRWWVQAGCLPDPGHGWYPSSLMPAEYVLCFAGRTHGRIKCRRLHREFMTKRSRTELGSSKTSSDGAGVNPQQDQQDLSLPFTSVCRNRRKAQLRQGPGVSPGFAPHRLAPGLPDCSGQAAGRVGALAGHPGPLCG